MSYRSSKSEARLALYEALADLDVNPGAPGSLQVAQAATSHELTPRELRALRRIWPKFQLEFKLEDRRVVSKTAGRGNY